METRVSDDRLSFLKIVWGFNNVFMVRDLNCGGGLACFWNDTVSLPLLSYSLLHLDFAVNLDGGGIMAVYWFLWMGRMAT